MSQAPHADTPGRVWRGTTGGARAAARRAQLVEVGTELLSERGAAGITVREVYARARLNPRYFYESFEDLDALLVAVYEELVREMVALVLAAVDAAADREPAKTRAAVETAFRFLTDDPRRIQILLVEALGHTRLARMRGDLVATAAAMMASQAAGFYGIPSDARLLRSTTLMIAGGLAEIMIAWHNATLELTVDELIDDASALVSGLGDAAQVVAAERSARS